MTAEEDIDQAKTIHKLKLSNWVDKCEQLIKDQKPLYEMIHESISDMSLAKIKEDPDYEDIKLKKDPLRLLKRIKATHANNTASTIPAIIQDTALSTYYDLKQKPGQSITSYKKKFDEALIHLKDVGETVPSQSAQASRFIKGLEDARYATFKTQLSNLTSLAGGTFKYPDTLVLAFTKANEFLVTTESGITVNASVYATHGKPSCRCSHYSSAAAPTSAKSSSQLCPRYTRRPWHRICDPPYCVLSACEWFIYQSR